MKATTRSSPAKPTGRTYETDFVHLITFRDGKIRRFQEFFDTYAAAEAFLAPAVDSSTFDCASAPGACVLSLAFLGPQIEFAEAPLTFDASVPPSTPPAAAGDTNVPADAGGAGNGEGAAAASSSTAPTSSAPTVNGAPLARTGTDVRNPLRYDLLLLVVGALALVAAAALRARAHRRASHAEP